MSNDKPKFEGESSGPPNGGKSPLTGWAAVLALLGAGAVPCPECGAPLAWHLWPLAALLLAARLLSRRGKGSRKPDPAASGDRRPEDDRA